MRRWQPWIGLAVAAALLALGWFSGVLPGVFAPHPPQSPAPKFGVPTARECAEGYLAVYNRMLPSGAYMADAKTVGVDLTHAANLDQDARDWLLEQIGKRSGCAVVTGSYEDLRAQGYVERDGNLTFYGDGFFLVTFRDEPYGNGSIDLTASAGAGPLNGISWRVHLRKTLLGWKIDVETQAVA